MKLLVCGACFDVQKLLVGTPRSCECGQSSGVYVDNLNAQYTGDQAVLVGFANGSLVRALREADEHPTARRGPRFEAFAIPPGAATVRKVETLEVVRLVEGHVLKTCAGE